MFTDLLFMHVAMQPVNTSLCLHIHSSGANSHLVQISMLYTPTRVHVYSNWLAKAVSSWNNCGKQRCSDNLAAAIVVYDVQVSIDNFST